MVSNLLPRRAHHPEQRAERRDAIIATATAALAETPYEQLSMARIALAAGLAKGTLYLYFPTKEALFLEVLDHLYRDAFFALQNKLEQLHRGADADAIATAFADVLAQRPLFRELVSRMHTVLERNIDHATARRFKQALRDAVISLGAVIEQSLGAMPRGAGAALVMEAHVLTVGWQHAANPAPVIRDVQQDADLRLFEADFASRFRQSFAALLRGWSRSSHTSA